MIRTERGKRSGTEGGGKKSSSFILDAEVESEGRIEPVHGRGRGGDGNLMSDGLVRGTGSEAVTCRQEKEKKSLLFQRKVGPSCYAVKKKKNWN